MTSIQRVWLTPQARERLQAELAALISPTTMTAGDTLDRDDYMPTRHHRRQARIRQIQDLLGDAVVGQDPPDDGNNAPTASRPAPPSGSPCSPPCPTAATTPKPHRSRQRPRPRLLA